MSREEADEAAIRELMERFDLSPKEAASRYYGGEEQ